MSKLIKFELTEKGKAFLPQEGGHPHGRTLVLPSNDLGDSHFACRGGLLRDYHCEQILARKDGKGAQFVKRKAVSKQQEVKAKK